MRVGLAAAVLLMGMNAPGASYIYHGPFAGHHYTLTFDAGADRGFAARILSTLEHAHAHATFGMTGAWARSNPDLVRRMARDGDTFINHTYDHRSFTGFSSKTAPLDQRQRTWEITQTERIIHRLTNTTTKPYFRPPFGDVDGAVPALARKLGYTMLIMWTVDSLGWEGLPASSIVTRCLAQVHPGTILLMHVGSQSQDAVALPHVLAGLKRAGLTPVTLQQLLH
jgi:peptidoglycan/xylan/chitin deacetylase (PgdA/CDA1 family)